MRTILITGANSEIASEYVKHYGDGYDRIIMHYGHRKDRVVELEGLYGSAIIPINADFSKRDEIGRFIEIIKEYEIEEFLHLPAPKLRHIRFVKGSIDEFELEMQVVYWSFLRICQTLIPGMTKRRTGRILAVLTEYTVDKQPPYLSHYISAKFALLGLIKSLASEFGSKGIGINGISPGMIETDFISKLPQYVVDDNAKTMTRERNLIPADLVPTVSYLLSKDSEGINGQNIMIR